MSAIFSYAVTSKMLWEASELLTVSHASWWYLICDMFLLFPNPNKAERVQPMRSCCRSSGVITPTLHTNASNNREAVDVTAALRAQMDLNLHLWYSPDNPLFFHTSTKTQRRNARAFVCEANLRGAAAALQLCDSRAWDAGDVEVSRFLFFVFHSPRTITTTPPPPPSPTTENIRRALPISSFLKRCCDSRGINFTV